MKKILVLLAVIGLSFGLVNSVSAKGGGGGRGGGFSGSRSVSRPSAPKPAPKPAVPKAPKVPNTSKVSSKTIVTKSSTTKTINGKSYGKKGYTVNKDYQPKFRGYSAPEGSTVYYRSSAWDWFPMYYILTHDSHREAVVSEPSKDGKPAKEIVVKEEGKDSMYFINWFLAILLLGGLGVGIVYLVNRATKKYV